MDPTELVELELDEVSLVDVPANKSAVISLIKRETNMDEQTIKALEEEVTALKADKDALTAQVTELTAEKEALTKKLEDIKTEQVDKAEETIEFDGEKVAKSSIPAVVLKRLEKMASEKEQADLITKAKETVPHLKGTDEQKARLIKFIGGDEELMSMIAAADKLFAKAFDEIGDIDATDLTNPNEQLTKMAKNYATEKATTFEKAYATVIKTEAGKKLLNEIRNKDK